MTRKTILFLFIGLALFTFSSCKKEKKTNDIITKITPKPKKSDKTIAMESFSYKKIIDWLGAKYTLTIVRKPNKESELVTDEEGRKYYDNTISLKITRADGTEFFNKVFTKTDFKTFFDEPYAKDGALVGLMFDSIDMNTLRFGASIGSPAVDSDEYVPIDLVLDNLGHITMTKSTQLDTSSDQQSTSKKPKDMIESAEEDGM